MTDPIKLPVTVTMTAALTATGTTAITAESARQIVALTGLPERIAALEAWQKEQVALAHNMMAMAKERYPDAHAKIAGLVAPQPAQDAKACAYCSRGGTDVDRLIQNGPGTVSVCNKCADVMHVAFHDTEQPAQDAPFICPHCGKECKTWFDRCMDEVGKMTTRCEHCGQDAYSKPQSAQDAAQPDADEAAVDQLRCWSVGYEYYYDAYFGSDAPFGNQQLTAATLAEVLQNGARLVPQAMRAKDAQIAALRRENEALKSALAETSYAEYQKVNLAKEAASMPAHPGNVEDESCEGYHPDDRTVGAACLPNREVQPADTEPAEQAGRGPLGCDELLDSTLIREK